MTILDAVISSAVFLILLSFGYSAKSRFDGTFVGFDFTWIKNLFNRKAKQTKEKTQ